MLIYYFIMYLNGEKKKKVLEIPVPPQITTAFPHFLPVYEGDFSLDPSGNKRPWESLQMDSKLMHKSFFPPLKWERLMSFNSLEG